MKKYIGLVILFLAAMLALSGCFCEHEWLSATCLSPKTCALCQKTEGEELDHTWQSATCDMPKKCGYCGQTEGEPIGHTWTDATCSVPMTCSACDMTQGDPLPHTPETQSETDYVRAVRIETQSCSECGTVLNSGETTVSLVDGDFFCMSPEEFAARLNHVYASTGKTDWSAALEVEEGEANDYFMAVLRCDDVVHARIFFTSEATPITEQEKNDRIITHIQVGIYYAELADQLNDWTDNDITVEEGAFQISSLLADESMFLDILSPVLQTCNPLISEEDADAFIHDAFERTNNFFDYENIIYQSQCDDVFVEVTNLFLANLSYLVGLSTSSEHWVNTAEIGK